MRGQGLDDDSGSDLDDNKDDAQARPRRQQGRPVGQT